MSAVTVPPATAHAAFTAATEASRVHQLLAAGFVEAGRLESAPGQIEAAIDALKALKPMVGDLRQAAGLPRQPIKPDPQTEGEAR